MKPPKEVTRASKAFGVFLIVAAFTAPASVLAVLYVFGQVASAVR